MGWKGKIKKRIFYYIKNNKLRELQHFIKINDLILKRLQYCYGSNNNLNFLLYAIKQNVSFEMIVYIYSECQCEFENLNYGRVEESLLFNAIKNESFIVADFLINNKADIQYKMERVNKTTGNTYEENFINTLIKNSNNLKEILKNRRSLLFILGRGFKISNSLLTKEIEKKETENYLLEFIINYCGNEKVLTLLSLYGSKISLTTEELNKIITKDKPFHIDFSILYKAIQNNKVKISDLLLNYYKCNFNIEEILLNLFHGKGKDKSIYNYIKKRKKICSLDDVTIENIYNYDDISSHIKSWIENNDMYHLKCYVENRKISKTFIDYLNLFKYAINKNCSTEIIEFFYKYYNCHLVKEDRVFLAKIITNKHFKMANTLLKNGSEVQLGDVIMCNKLLYDKKIIRYFLHKNPNFLNNIIEHSIKDQETFFLKYVIRYCIIDKLFILNLLKIYKDQTPLTNSQLKLIINKEKEKIKIDKSIYRYAVEYKSSDIIKILMDIDIRDKSVIINEIYNAYYEVNKYHIDSNKICDFFNSLDKSFSVNPEIKNHYREKIMEFINNNCLNGLKQYIKDNMIILYTLKNKTFDVLLYALEKNASFEIIEYILSRSPSIRNVKCYDETQYLKSFVNYIDRNKSFKGVDYLYREYKYMISFLFNIKSHKILKYIVNCDEKKITHDYTNDRILNFLKYHYFYDKNFVLQLLLFYSCKKALSTKQLKIMLYKEKYKTEIKSLSYNTMLIGQHFDKLGKLLSIQDDPVIIYQLNSYLIKKEKPYIQGIHNLEQPKFKKSLEQCIRQTPKESIIILKLLTSNGWNIESVDRKGNTCLIYALESENMELIKYIIGNSKYYQKKINMPYILKLIQNKRIDIVKILIRNYLVFNNEKYIQFYQEAMKCNLMELIEYYKNRKNIIYSEN